MLVHLYKTTQHHIYHECSSSTHYAVLNGTRLRTGMWLHVLATLSPTKGSPSLTGGWESPIAHLDSLEQSNSLPLSSNNSQFLECQAHILIHVTTELAQLPIILQSLAYQTALMLKGLTAISIMIGKRNQPGSSACQLNISQRYLKKGTA